MLVASTMVRPSSTRIGNFLIGQSLANSSPLEVEGNVVLVEGDQRLLAIGRERVAEELQGHGRTD